MRVILAKTSPHEIALQKRFELLREANEKEEAAEIVLPEVLMSPIICTIPQVEFGFVYILVSKSQCPRIVEFVGNTESNLLHCPRNKIQMLISSLHLYL